MSPEGSCWANSATQHNREQQNKEIEHAVEDRSFEAESVYTFYSRRPPHLTTGNRLLPDVAGVAGLSGQDKLSATK